MFDFQQIRFDEVFDITNPRYNGPIGPVSWHFVNWIEVPLLIIIIMFKTQDCQVERGNQNGASRP